MMRALAAVSALLLLLGGAVAFPDEDLPIIIEAAPTAVLTDDPGNWAFEDITNRLIADPITIRAGRAPGSATAEAGSCSLTLDDNDGALTPLNPHSPYFPGIALGMPLRVRLERAVDTFNRTVSSGWGTADTGQEWTSFGAGGSVLATDFNVAAGTGTHLVPVANANRGNFLSTTSLADVEVLVTVTLPVTNITGGSAEPANILLRGTSISSFYTARVEITTAEAVLVKLYNPAGSLLASATVPGLTHTSAQALRVRAHIKGGFLAMKVWAAAGSEPAGWHVTADDTSAPVAGWVGISSGLASGSTNAPMTFSYDDVQVIVDLATGYADSWAPDFVPTTEGDVSAVVRVTASGILRRLSQGNGPLHSPLYRFISGSSPLAWWPLESDDPQAITSLPSGLPGGTPLEASGPGHAISGVTGGVAGPAGASYAVELASNADVTAVLPTSATTAFRVELAVKYAVPLETLVLDTLFQVDFGGGYADVLVDELAGQELGLVLNGATFTSVTAPVIIDDGLWHHVRLDLASSGGGANTAYTLAIDGTVALSGTAVGMVFGHPTDLHISPITSFALSHPVIWAGTLPAASAGYEAFTGHQGEAAGVRFLRLCAEESIPATITGTSSQAMGAQTTGTLLENLQECETVNTGGLGESGFGLHFICLPERYNRPVDLTIDLSTYRAAAGTSSQVLRPMFDDQRYRNRWTIDRPDGSQAIADLSSGGLVYEDSATSNVETDQQLPGQAWWRTYRDSITTNRYPNTPLSLSANPDLIDGWVSVTPGLGRIVRTGLPANHLASDIDEMLDGYTETLARRSWTAHYNGSSSDAYDIAVYGVDPGGIVSRYGAASTVLAEALDAAETAADVDSGGEVWATTATHPTAFPFNVTIGGLVYSCTAITGTAPSYTLTLVRLSSDKTHSIGAAVTVTDTGRYAL